MTFAYQRYTITASAVIGRRTLYRPEVPLRVTGTTGHAYLLALVDSGADDTLFPRSVGEAIGVIINDSERVEVAGIGGQRIPAARGEVRSN